MPANYPNSVPTFTNKSAGQVIGSAHINQLQDEVAAIGAGLLQGTAPLNSSNSTLANLSVPGNSSLSGNLAVGGNLSLTGNFVAASGMSITGTISPAALSSGDTNDYAPTGLSSCFAIRITGAAGGSTLSGLVAQSAGFRLLINAGATVLGIKNNAGSAAANQIIMRSGTDTSIAATFGSMLIWHDAVNNRWRQIG
jgi:hypothetical protein